jgi:hypothetical protein
MSIYVHDMARICKAARKNGFALNEFWELHTGNADMHM